MKDQMEMSFGQAETRDPVSGNDVPPGSLPKEVRDDIPARLSEGEYVVPADVVRYYGVKFFEDLRTQAKMGLQQMDADGRIGGEPIEPQQGLTEADLAGLEQMLVTGVAEGGLMDKIAYTAQNDPLVNQRINGMGMEVGFASGGMAQSLFSDPTKIDQIISQVTALAQQKPEIMQELAKRGISITRTNAQVQPQQMQKQNSPAQTTNPVVNAAEGVLATGEFNPNRFRTVGGTYFEPETYSPDFGVKPPTPVSVPTDVAAPVEPAGGCGKGMMWNGLMCVVDPNYRYEESEGPDPEPEEEEEGLKKSWYEGDEDFYTDPKSYIEKQLARGEYKKESLLASLLVPGAGLAMGVANKIDDLNGIAKARATFEINQAFKTEGFEKGNPWADNMQKTLDSLGYNLVASGNMYKDSFAKDIDFDDWEDATGSDIGEAARRKDAYAKSRAIERERLQREQESTYVPSPEEQVFVQTILKEQEDRSEGPGNIGRGDGSRPSGVSSSAKGVSSMPSPSASPSVTMPGSSPTSSTTSSKGKSSTSKGKSLAQEAEDKYSGGPGFRNRGGLVQRRKKKK